MKPEKIYQELKELAEKLEVRVSEQNFRATGVKAKSGLCKLRGNNLFIIDKNKSVSKKIRILASQLAGMPHESVFIVPAVRELLEKHKEK